MRIAAIKMMRNRSSRILRAGVFLALAFACGFFTFPLYFEWKLRVISKNFYVFKPTNESIENTLTAVSLRASGLSHDDVSDKLRSELRRAESLGDLYYFERKTSEGLIRVGYLSINRYGKVLYSIEEPP